MSSSQRDKKSAPDDALRMGWSGTERDRRNKTAHFRWSVMLAVSFVAATFMLKAGIGRSVALKSAITAVPIALLVPWLFAYLRFLREADELVRKIQMEGIAVGFWAGASFDLIYAILQVAGLPRLHSAAAILVAVMMLGYAVGRVYAGKRYR